MLHGGGTVSAGGQAECGDDDFPAAAGGTASYPGSEMIAAHSTHITFLLNR